LALVAPGENLANTAVWLPGWRDNPRNFYLLQLRSNRLPRPWAPAEKRL